MRGLLLNGMGEVGVHMSLPWMMSQRIGDAGAAERERDVEPVQEFEMLTKAIIERRFDALWLRKRVKGREEDGATEKVRCTLRLIPLKRDRNEDLRNQEDFVVALASRNGLVEHFEADCKGARGEILEDLRALSRSRWRRESWVVQQIHFDRRTVGALWIHQDEPDLFHVVVDLCPLFTESGCPETLLDAVAVGLIARLNLKAGVRRVKLCGRSITFEVMERVEEALRKMRYRVMRRLEICRLTSRAAPVFEVDAPSRAKDRDCEAEMTLLLLRKSVVERTPTLSMEEEIEDPLFEVIGWMQNGDHTTMLTPEIPQVEKDMNVYLFVRLRCPPVNGQIFDFRLQVLSEDGKPVNCNYRFKEPACYRQRVVLYKDDFTRQECVGFIPYQKGPLIVVLEMRQVFTIRERLTRRTVRIEEVIKKRKRPRSSGKE